MHSCEGQNIEEEEGKEGKEQTERKIRKGSRKKNR
jgi:hypothetical protein